MVVKGNFGTTRTTHKSYVKGYCEVWFDEWSIIKILTLKNVKSKFIVTYYSNNDVVFTVHNPSVKDVQFNIHKDRLQYQNTNNCRATLIETISDN